MTKLAFCAATALLAVFLFYIALDAWAKTGPCEHDPEWLGYCADADIR